MAWTIARWVIAIGAVVCALLYLNHALFSAWQTVAPPGYKHPEAWAYQAYKSLGYSVAFLAAAILVMINLRPGWPYWKNRWTALAFIVAILGLALPRAQHFLKVDACLDQGGSWDYVYQVCKK